MSFIDKAKLKLWQLMPITNSIILIIEFVVKFNKYRTYDSFTTNRDKVWSELLLLASKIDTRYLELQIDEYKNARKLEYARVASSKDLSLIFARIIADKQREESLGNEKDNTNEHREAA